MKLKLSYPLEKVHIFQRFGENQLAVYKTQLGLNGHNGIDFQAPHGTPVYACHDGEVTYAGVDGSGGLTIVIKTLQPFEYKDGESYFKTIYCHLATGSMLVKAGDKVVGKQKIAEADNTGLSTGDHLHFGCKPITQGEQDWQWFNLEKDNGYNGAIDPLPYFDGTFPNKEVFVRVDTFTPLMQAVKAFQLSEGINDFANETNLSKIRIGNKTLNALKKYQK